MPQAPVVSVLMATYNTPNQWLSEAIDSILQQTFTDFEFIIVDDCSTTDITPVQQKYTDERIIWIKNEENLGLTKSLNKILKLARGKYIARMDSDDISLPERFSVQVDYMEKHPNIIVAGAYRQEFGMVQARGSWNIPSTRARQQAELFFYNCGLTHPTAMFRREMLLANQITYNEKYVKAQDYGIWVQCTRYAPMAMIPKILLEYRKSEQQISVNGRSHQLECDAMVHFDQLTSLGLSPTEEEKKMHIAFCRKISYVDAQAMQAWVEKLADANAKARYFDVKIFKKLLEEHWFFYCDKMYHEEGIFAYKAMHKKAIRLRYRVKKLKLKLITIVLKTLGK